ncbi:MAG: methylated-DNA--[protein]-cysteine S-methyltransferase [Planctomycetota bacterium]|jgi:methylated-DNA-[protein]-cysteine S-methyltransferase
MMKFTIFETKWGYFGLAGTEKGLFRSHLPAADEKRVRANLLKNLTGTAYDKDLFKSIQRQIAAYFEGRCVNFDTDIPVLTDGLSRFTTLALTACREITYGQTITYGHLTAVIKRPHAARAIGRALSANRLPLLIPCHRVIKSDGSLGGFSPAGGPALKKKLLLHEKRCLQQ